MARQKNPGTIVRIDLGDGYHTYARELNHPFIAVYDARSIDPMDPEQIVSRPPLFIVGVFDQAFRRWKKVGCVPLRQDELVIPDRFIQDVINLEDCRIVDADGHERPAKIDECEGLESASIWDSDEVVDRIQDYHFGRSSKWVELLKVRRLNNDTNKQ